METMPDDEPVNAEDQLDAFQHIQERVDNLIDDAHTLTKTYGDRTVRDPQNTARRFEGPLSGDARKQLEHLVTVLEDWSHDALPVKDALKDKAESEARSP